MNTKQTEALKLALEALGAFEKDKRVDYRAWDESKASEAIAAIREALAEQGCDYCNHPQYAGTKCKNCGREQPAPPPECKTDAEKTAFAFGWWKALEENRKQPAQDREPCGWRMKHNGEWAYSFTKDAWDFIYAVSPAARKAARDNAPASKPWVGLTNQELIDLTAIYSGAPLYCAIEAKLREKNA